MKTAMQELIEELEVLENNAISLSDKFLIKSIRFKTIAKLEKENEQRINDFVEGFKISGEGWNGEYGIKDFNNIKEEIKAEELINKTYKNNNENKN